MGIKLFIHDARLSFLTLGEPEYFGGKKTKDTDKRRWSATALLAPDTMAQRCDERGNPTGPKVNARQLVDEALAKAAQEKWDKKAQIHLSNILPDPKGCCYISGDRKTYDGYAGMMALSAHRNEDQGRPLVLDNDRSPIYMQDNSLYPEKAGRLFSGAYGNVHVEIWAQDNMSGKGLRAGLLGVQRTRTGDSFGGGSAPVADAFGDVADGATADDLG
jgi:hypothetical protein